MSGFDLEAVRSGLMPGEIEWLLGYEAACDSTQDLARAAAAAGAPEGWTIVTDLQRAGRGRQGHQWSAPPGQALLFSLLLRPAIDVFAKLPLLAGLSVAGAIESFAGLVPELKWPNDVLLRDRKLAGVLLERPAGSTVVLGIGVNVGQSAADLPAGATSLSLELGRPPAREALLAAVLNDLSNAYERADREGVRWIVPAWRSRSSMLGRPISWIGGGKRAQGVAEDISESGGLLVRTAEGAVVELVAGEVEQIRPAQGPDQS